MKKLIQRVLKEQFTNKQRLKDEKIQKYLNGKIIRIQNHNIRQLFDIRNCSFKIVDIKIQYYTDEYTVYYFGVQILSGTVTYRRDGEGNLITQPLSDLVDNGFFEQDITTPYLSSLLKNYFSLDMDNVVVDCMLIKAPNEKIN